MTVRRRRPANLPDPAAHRLVIVEASAGTGKTFFLEHRVIDLLLRTRATIDQILVVTFTEKATAELRTRIRTKIAELAIATESDAAPGEPAWAIDDDARRKLRDALAGFDRAPIHTIHGFCQRLLIEDAFSGRRLFDQTQVPDEAAFVEAFHQTLRAELAVDEALCRVLRAYLDAGGTVAKLRDTLLACARRGAPVTPELDPVRLGAAADRYVAAFAALPAVGESQARAEAGLGNLAQRSREALAKRLVALYQALAEVPGGEPDARAIALARTLDGCCDALEWFAENHHKVTAPLPAGAALRDAALELAAAHVPVLAIAAARFLPRILERVRTSKSRRGQFDFQDMLRLVRDTLLGDRGAELTARLRRRLPVAMIDEFQDTDEVQWDIFRRIWGEADTTSLTIVGDPKQAIYSFRGADVQTYLDACQALRGHGALELALDENFRSSPDVVAAVNELLGKSFFSGGIAYRSPVRAASQTGAHRPDGGALAPVEVLEIDPRNGKLEAEELVATIAESFAERIAALLAPPEPERLQVRDRKGEARPLRPQDIYVLTRSGAQSDQVAEALRARGVPCALYQREHLFDSREALEVADVLAAIADPRDRSARLRAWTTSFFAVPLAGLEELVDVPDGHPLLTLLHDWRGVALRKRWDELFHRILEDTRWIERTLIAGGGERAVTNVLHVFELLHEELARAPAELHELEARLRGWIRDGTIDRPDDVDIQRLETDKQAVQIMTIHRAKGLEAAVVFLHGGQSAPPADVARLYHDVTGRRLLHVGTAIGEVDERIAEDVIAENQRLMYVAMTRAKVRLVVAIFPAYKYLNERSPVWPLHKRLETALQGRQTDPESARLFEHSRVTAGSVAPPPPAEVAAHLAGWTPPAEPPESPEAEAPWRAIRRQRGGVVVTSYSRLKHAAARESDRDDARGDEHSTVIALGPEELPAGAATGLFLHEVLEHVPFETSRAHGDASAWAASDAVAPVLARAARRHGIDDEHRRAGADLLYRTLSHRVVLGGRELGTLATAPRVAKEVEFAYPLALPDGRPAFARGYVDLLVAWDDQLWIVDYKSDAIGAQTAAEARVHVDRHYDQQSKLYAVAAARLLRLDGAADCARRFGGVLYWFLRSNLIVERTVRWPELARWTDELGAAIAASEEESP